MLSTHDQGESSNVCKICKRDGRASKLTDHEMLREHLRSDHGINLDKPKEKGMPNSSAPSSPRPNNGSSSYPKQNNGRNFQPKPDLYSDLMHQKVNLHLADKVLTGTIQRVSMYDLFFSADSEDGRNSDLLVPKHSVKYVERV